MAPVTGTLQSGTYHIINLSTKKYVTLGDANKGSKLFSSGDKDSDNVKWNITKLSNDYYTVANYIWATYGATGASPNAKDPVKANSDSYQWAIKETGNKSQYLIEPGSDDLLYWSFENSNDGTPLKLSSDGSNDQAKWQFERVAA